MVLGWCIEMDLGALLPSSKEKGKERAVELVEEFIVLTDGTRG